MSQFTSSKQKMHKMFVEQWHHQVDTDLDVLSVSAVKILWLEESDSSSSSSPNRNAALTDDDLSNNQVSSTTNDSEESVKDNVPSPMNSPSLYSDSDNEVINSSLDKPVPGFLGVEKKLTGDGLNSLIKNCSGILVDDIPNEPFVSIKKETIVQTPDISKSKTVRKHNAITRVQKEKGCANTDKHSPGNSTVFEPLLSPLDARDSRVKNCSVILVDDIDIQNKPFVSIKRETIMQTPDISKSKTVRKHNPIITQVQKEKGCANTDKDSLSSSSVFEPSSSPLAARDIEKFYMIDKYLLSSLGQLLRQPNKNTNNDSHAVTGSSKVSQQMNLNKRDHLNKGDHSNKGDDSHKVKGNDSKTLAKRKLLVTSDKAARSESEKVVKLKLTSLSVSDAVESDNDKKTVDNFAHDSSQTDSESSSLEINHSCPKRHSVLIREFPKSDKTILRIKSVNFSDQEVGRANIILTKSITPSESFPPSSAVLEKEVRGRKRTSRQAKFERPVTRAKCSSKSAQNTNSPSKSSKNTISPSKSSQNTNSPSKSSQNTNSPSKSSQNTNSPSKSKSFQRSYSHSTKSSEIAHSISSVTVSCNSSPSKSQNTCSSNIPSQNAHYSATSQTSLQQSPSKSRSTRLPSAQTKLQSSGKIQPETQTKTPEFENIASQGFLPCISSAEDLNSSSSSDSASSIETLFDNYTQPFTPVLTTSSSEDDG